VKYLFIFLFFVFVFNTYTSCSQSHNIIDGATLFTCSGTLYDTGGPNGFYNNNETITYTICPGSGGVITLDFTLFDIENIFDQLAIYDGNSINDPLIGTYTGVGSPGFIQASSTNTSGCLTLVFTSDFMITAQGWEATIGCTSACQEIIANATFTPVPDADSVLRICQGTTVNFNGSGTYPQNNSSYAQSDATSTFTWNTQDGSNPTGQNASHTFNNEGIYFVELEIEDINGCTNDVELIQEVHVSTTPDFSGITATPDSICLGEQATLNGIATPVTFDNSCTQPVIPVTPLPDGSGVPTITTVNLDCFNSGQTLTNINDLLSVCVNIEHSYLGDLSIEVECPSGQTVTLKNLTSGGSTPLGIPLPGLTPGTGFDYCWSPTATNGTMGANAFGFTLPAGTYESDNPMSSLVGCDLNGVWTLTLFDSSPGDDGFLFDWSINFDPAIIPPSTSFTPTIVSENWQADPTIVSGTNPIIVEPTASGSACYTYEVTDNFGCNYDTTYCIYVNPQIVLDTLPDVVQCTPYVLPAITGSNLSGNEAYYTGINGTGTQYNAGDVITSSTTLYVYDSYATNPTCEAQNSFSISIGVSNTVLNCPPPSNFNCASAIPPPFPDINAFTLGGGTVSFGFGTATIINSFTLLNEVTAGNGCQETITRTYQVTDDCGLNYTCDQVFNIVDSVNPTGTAPADITV
jgi:hypothetical protein